MRNLIIVLLVVFSLNLKAQDGEVRVLPENIQIITAVLPLQEGEKAGAAVYGYDSKGNFVLLREGTNNMVCLGDDPQKEGISVSCYPRSLEPYMARGRELNAQGLSLDEKMKIRGQEIRTGKLKMPGDPATLSVYFGKEADYDPGTGLLSKGKYRFVVYTPFATSATMGLPDTPQPGGMPWLMNAGTHRAHIMIGPFDIE